MTAPSRRATVLSHQRVDDVEPTLRRLLELAGEEGVTLRFDPDETRKHALRAAPGVEVDADVSDAVELCFVLGGDGTILRGLRRYAGTGVPVFAVNYGEIGFLATIDPDGEETDAALRKAMAGSCDTLTLPAIALQTPDGPQAAINDLAIHRKVGERVAQLAYVVDGEEVGSVRCDGLVVATPAGSTGYNLANGGPVMAWGVEGFVVSFIAPHSLTARALVVAPSDTLEIQNRSRAAVDVVLDGRPVGELGPGEGIAASFLREATDLCQVPGSSFYRRLREKFGRLSS
ncbi:MAG TPA: NAD(+)/NADH kinase [Solirubrobacteraceae bacterium]|nr:NAD(+)/NADH kinase [Solirubrobacteraceae bacterium]